MLVLKRSWYIPSRFNRNRNRATNTLNLRVEQLDDRLTRGDRFREPSAQRQYNVFCWEALHGRWVHPDDDQYRWI